MPRSRVHVTTASEAAARDLDAIQSGTPSFTLMLRAGTAAAAAILREYADRLHDGVAIFAGVGNNGGDAYVVAAQLARAGIRARVHAVAPPRTADAQRAAALAAPRLIHGPPSGNERLVVDGLLGTAHRGALRDPVRAACMQLQSARDRGAIVVALDLPSGLDATTGEIATASVPCDLTVTFGTMKRGLLIARAHAGRVVLVDIGLDAHMPREDVAHDGAWQLADARAVAAMVPPIAWNTHKGRRGHVALVGGARGMAGALMLAARGALGAGCGLVRGYLESESGVAALQHAVPQAIAHAWPDATAPASAAPWGHALVVGPGLGRSDASLAALHRALDENVGVPLLLDADALTLLATARADGVESRLREIATRAAGVVCTPHAGEFARLTGAPLTDDGQARADRLLTFAQHAGVTVLLKGTPTLIAVPDVGRVSVVATGTPLLATGGSGDVLSGIIGALLAQGASTHDAAVLGATLHGRSAELVTGAHGGIRGLTLDAVLGAMPRAWNSVQQPVTFAPGVLHEVSAPLV